MLHSVMPVLICSYMPHVDSAHAMKERRKEGRKYVEVTAETHP